MMAFKFEILGKKNILFIVEWALRINVFIKLFIYGSGKILGGQFYRKGEIPEAIASIPLGEVNSYNLAWTFFGHSKGYILFIGISQLIGAFLLLFNRTKLLGGAILIPILLNIIVVDAFFGVAYGALFSACFYLASILFVFYRKKEEIIEAIRSLVITEPLSKIKKIPYQIVLIGIAFGVVFLIELFFIGVFGYEDR